MAVTVPGLAYPVTRLKRKKEKGFSKGLKRKKRKRKRKDDEEERRKGTYVKDCFFLSCSKPWPTLSNFEVTGYVFPSELDWRVAMGSK